MSTKFKLGDIVVHRTSEERGVVSYIHSSFECSNPEHTPPCSPRVRLNNPCTYEPVEVYNVSTGFGDDIEGVRGFLLREVKTAEDPSATQYLSHEEVIAYVDRDNNA
jgi:hypothetical protein